MLSLLLPGLSGTYPEEPTSICIVDVFPIGEGLYPVVRRKEACKLMCCGLQKLEDSKGRPD